MKRIGKKWLINGWWSVVAMLLVALLAVIAWRYFNDYSISPWLRLLTLTTFVCLVWGVCGDLTNIFSLRKQEGGITWCQILILFAIGIWIAGVVWIFPIHKSSSSTIVFGVIGGLMTMVFQDKIKGVVTFIHLRTHHLLNIGDWIRVPKYSIDGEVRKVTLTTVTIYNWDTTTSNIPISTLHSDHFINVQHMASGKTYGWRIDKTFLVATESVHALSKEEAEMLKSKEFNNKHNILAYLPEDEIKEGALNARLYRIYLHHYLMSQPDVSQMPRLLVQWLDQQKEGVQLHLYVFIITNNLDDFDWHQSLLVEYVMQSIEWFGLRLYQLPMSLDDMIEEANV